MKPKILAAIALAIGLCASAFAQTIIDEQGNFFDCCGFRSLSNQDVVDESYMGYAVSACDPDKLSLFLLTGDSSGCQQIRGSVTVNVSAVAILGRCSPLVCYATLPNPPEFFNATYSTSTATFTEGAPITDNNGDQLQWNCVMHRTNAPPFECTTWQLVSTMNFTDPTGLGYGTLHFRIHAANNFSEAQVRTYESFIPNPNYVPPPPPPSDD